MTKYVKIISLIGIMSCYHAAAATKNPMTACPTNYITIYLYDVILSSGVCSSGSSYELKLPGTLPGACDQIDTGHPYEACYVYAPSNFNFYDDTGTWQFTSECVMSNPF